MTKKIDTVLFDLDGTLINTIDLIMASFLHTMEAYFPGEYKREDVVPFIGPPLSETFTRLDPDNVEAMTKTYRLYNHENHDALVSEYEGVRETLEALYKKGVKMAVVTTKRRETAVKGLELMGMSRFFPVVITLDDVSRYKPDPEPLEKALHALGSKAENAVMVGDSEHDILGGQHTGTKTAAVAWSVKGRKHLEAFNPDVMLDNMKELLQFMDNSIGVEQN